MPKDEILHPDRLLRIAAAAEQFVRTVNEPRLGAGYDFRKRQQAAYERLVAVVSDSVIEREAEHATDS